MADRGSQIGWEIRYTYDELNRLVEVIYGAGQGIRYTYDAVGNRTARTIVVPFEEAFVPGPCTMPEATPPPLSEQQAETAPFDTMGVGSPPRPPEEQPVVPAAPDVVPQDREGEAPLQPGRVEAPRTASATGHRELQEGSLPQEKADSASIATPVCPECGAAIRPDLRFCLQCGYALSASLKPERALCQSCGEPLEAGVAFCTSCGARAMG